MEVSSMNHLINIIARNACHSIRKMLIGLLCLYGIISCSEEEVTYDRFSEAPAALGFRISDIEIQEGTASTVIEVGVSKRIFQDISFQLLISSSSNEILVTDENGSSINTMTLGPNKETEKFIITAMDDTQYTGDRQIDIGLSNLNGEGVFIIQELVSAQGQRLHHALSVSITDDETTPISITMKNSAAEILEGSETPHVIQVVLSEAITSSSSFEVTLSGTAIPNEDYRSSAVNSVITINLEEGETSRDIEIQPIDNELIDGDKTLLLTITNAGSGFIIGAENVHTLTIVDDDSETATATIQLVVSKDAWFRGKPGSNRADENQGEANTLIASQGDRDDDNRQFYLQFDLSSIDVSKVSSAIVELTAERDWTTAETANGGKPTTQSVFRTADNWEELTITANNQPEILSEDPVATFTSDILVGSADIENPPIHQYDVTAAVKQESDGVLSLLFTTVFTNSRRITYTSKEAEGDRQPRLILEIKQ